MASPRSPGMASLWGMPQHEVDHNGYSPSGVVGDHSFDSSNSRQRRGSSPGKRALNWFTRSRSGSPQIGEPPSPTSFVVKNVTKQPGGVSQGHYEDEYRKMKSQPLAASLGVPPGGPGGGIGYGTAKSSNDGRPEGERRGRSISPARPARPPSPGAITAGAFRSGRVSPGPQSWSQTRVEQEKLMRSLSRDRQTHSPQRLSQQGTSPTGPRSSPFSQQQQQQSGVGRSPHSSSPLANSVLAPSLSTVSVNANEHPSRFSMPVHFRSSSGPPPIIPLEGLPSPINIPQSPAIAGVTPLGSISPGGSPGRFQGNREHQAKASPASPNLASRWMKGLFGKSPRMEERADGMYSSSEPEAQWLKQGTSPSAPYSSKHLHNAWTDGSPLAGSVNRDEKEAEERKRHSMRMAAKIEDQHRDQLMRNRGTEAVKEWSPRQAVPIDDEQEWDPPQSKSPPGRKPVPRYSVQELQDMSQEEREVVANRVDPDDRLSKLEGRLTPAQQIIADTRSKQGIREKSQGRGATTQVQRGFKTEPAPSVSTNSLKEAQQDESETPVRRDSKRASPVKAKPAVAAAPSSHPTPRPSAAGLTAGNGPQPKDMSMGEAMQDMMVRFYRFERYAVPLMRSLEARIVDVERDNQMALHGDAMSANSARDREMDKWVGQMTGLMKHEIGQLKAATREIREGREILAACAKMQLGSSSGHLPSRSTVQLKKGPESPSSTQVELGKGSVDVEEKDTVAEMKAKEVDHNRKTNFSSSSFNSAIPRKMALDIPEKAVDQKLARDMAATASNSSPNGRMRYTSVLGQPMNRGKISPAVSPSKEKVAPVFVPSPTLSNQSGVRRMQSLDDRLKALVVDKSRSPSIASASTQASSQSNHGEEEDSTESDNTSFEKIASHTIGDDYQVVMARGQSQASARSASGGSSSGQKKIVNSTHLQTPSSTSSAKTEATIRKPVHQSSRSSSSGAGAGREKYLTSPSTTPSRQHQSSSPTPVTTSVLANNNLRARAQSYLLSADGSSSVTSSTPSSPSPSPRMMDSPPIFTKPLQVQRGYNNSNLLGSNAPTLKVKSNDNNNTPVRPSIRDRVAFFDAVK